MNKLPTKQIYLLIIIIVGIVALSVYSTYALFTFESSTSNIVSINTPKSLQIKEETSEYQQITVEANSVITTDVDIYNANKYDTCYSIWYKLLGNNIDKSKVQVFENSKTSLTTSGILPATTSIRVNIFIINDNDFPIKVNIGTNSSKKDENSCSLNIETDKMVIDDVENNPTNLAKKLLESIEKKNELEANYLTYKDIEKTMTYKPTDKLYISEKFNYADELFTLQEPAYLSLQEIVEKEYLQKQPIYFCKDSDKCPILYKMTNIEKKENANDISYNITKYDKLVGFSKGINGLRQANEKDYVFYGDNPDNFIYYNCKNNLDTKTCELWRIIGLFYNQETDKYNIKIVKNDSIGKYQFDKRTQNSENSLKINWANSQLKEYLTKEYKFINNYDVYLDNPLRKLEIIKGLDADVKSIAIASQSNEETVTTISLSDYLYTSTCKNDTIDKYGEECFKNNWLNNPEYPTSWTIATKEIPEKNETPEEENDTTNQTQEDNLIANFAYTIGKNITASDVNELHDVRPVVYLKPRTLLLQGNGSIDNPYVIK